MKNPKTNVAKYLISILMIGIGFGVYAEAVISNPTSLRVGSSNSFPPINMIDSDGELTGFGRDLSDAVLESIGVRPERKHSSVWTDVLDWLDKGEIDFIHDTGYTKDRDAYLDYTRPIIEMPEMIFVRNENLDINTLDSLNGKVVACVNKHITHLYLKQYPQIKCHIVYKPVEGLYALMGGTVDAFVYPREIVMYFAQNLRVSDKVKMVGEPLRYLSWSMTVKEGNSEVVTLLNEGIQKIHKNGEYERIYNKWFGKRLLAGYTQAEVRIIIIAVVVLSLFAGISLALLIYNRRLTNARDALEQSEKKYSEIASSIPGAVFQIGKTGDQEFRLNFISQGIAKEIGVSSNKLLGSIDNFIMYICADDRSRFMQSLEDSILAEVPWNIEFRIETVSGGMMWFGASAAAPQHKDDSLLSNGVLLNISERKELQIRQEHFFQLTNNMLCIAGFDGHFKLLNPSWVSTLGYNIQELTAVPFIHFVHPDDQSKTILEAEKLANRKGHTINFENRYRCKNGEYRYLSWVAVSSPYADEIYAAAHDITELKKAEKELLRAYSGLEEKVELRTIELQEANKHLRNAEREMRIAKEKADYANNAKSEFLSCMSHELRTPLNVILGFAQLIEMDPSMQQTGDENYAGEIIGAGEHLLDLINEVLDLSKIEAGKIQLEVEDLDITIVVDDCLSIIKPLADKREINIKIDEKPGCISIAGDKMRLKQVMLNLLSNAVKYNSENGMIDIAYEINDDVISVSISDTGIGMSQSDMTNLFQPFNRLGAENSSVEGTGIGLVVTKKLIELMGGELRVSSEKEKGSCFTVIFNHTKLNKDKENSSSRQNNPNFVVM